MAHVIFNVLTGAVALLLLPVFTLVLGAVNGSDLGGQDLTIVLAISHTSFNLLGLLLMWPLEPVLSRRLLGLYEPTPAKRNAGSHLDANVASIPDLALRAMTLELSDLLESAGDLRLPLGRQQANNMGAVGPM